MSSIGLITAVFASSVGVAFSQNPDITEKRHFTFSCSAVYRAATDYFPSHGIESVGPERLNTLSLRGSVRLGGVKRWTDAKGERMSDAKVYWIYTSKKAAPDTLPLGWWHLRLSHYAPEGELQLTNDEEGCNAELHLYFEASGANVVVILPMDSFWSNKSNGRLEREYFDGISKALTNDKPLGASR